MSVSLTHTLMRKTLTTKHSSVSGDWSSSRKMHRQNGGGRGGRKMLDRRKDMKRWWTKKEIKAVMIEVQRGRGDREKDGGRYDDKQQQREEGRREIGLKNQAGKQTDR